MTQNQSLDRLLIVAKGFLELPNLIHYQKKESLTFQKLGSWDFWRIANSVLNKGKSSIPPLLNGPEVFFSSASDKEKLLAENFSKNSNFDDLGISLPIFPSRINLKLYNFSVTPRWLKWS